MNTSLQFPLTAVECFGCQTCSFQRGHTIGYKDANGRWARIDELVPMVAALEAALTQLVEQVESYCQSTGHKEEGAAMFGACDAICAAIPAARAALGIRGKK